MDLKLKKVWAAAAVSLLSITSAASADMGSQSAKGATKGPMGVVNPNARPEIDDARGFATAEVLFWKVTEDGLAYGIENQEVPVLATAGVSATSSSGFYNAKVRNPDFDWDVGFRVGLGYNLTHDGWDLYATWTYLRNNSSTHDDADSGSDSERFYTLHSASVGTPGGTIPTTPQRPFYRSADVKWTVRLNIIDVELGREFYTSKFLTLRPFVGVRAAAFNQSYNIDYHGGTFVDVSSNASLEEVNMKNNFFGVGLRAGLNSQWMFTQEWSFYGNAAISLVYGRFEIDQEEFNGEEDVAGSTRILEVDDVFRAARAITDLAFGIRYDHDFEASNYHLALWLGWEQHIAFNQNQLVHYNSIPGTAYVGPPTPATYTTYVPESGDLTYEGFTLGISFDF